MWAGTHHIQVTNNSYFADPWLFNCKNDAEQRAIWTAERRAIRFAMQQGDVVVSAEGQPGRRPFPPDAGCDQPGRHDAGDPRDHQRLRGRSGRGSGVIGVNANRNTG